MRPPFTLLAVGALILLPSVAHAEGHPISFKEEATTHFCATVTKLWNTNKGNFIAFRRDADGDYGSIAVSDSDYGHLEKGDKVTIGPVEANLVEKSLTGSHDAVFTLPGATIGCHSSGDTVH